jgi:hypothetical protein
LIGHDQRALHVENAGRYFRKIPLAQHAYSDLLGGSRQQSER